MGPPRRGDVARHGVGREEEDVAVAAGGQHDGVAGVGADLAGQQVAGDDAGAAAVDDDDVDELDPVPQLDVAEADLAGHLLVGAEQELLAGLAAGVERAADLGAAEAAVVEQAAVLAGERHALGDHLVDDVHRHLGQAVDVGLAGAEVAALDGVVEQPVDAVAVAAVVLGRVDAALGGDRVGPARRVVERERLDLVAELGERGGRRRPGQPGADDEDLVLALVGRVDQLRVGDEGVPLLGERAGGDLASSVAGGSAWRSSGPRSQISTIPARTAIGNEQLPTTMTVAMAAARPAAPRVEARVVPPHRLEEAPDAVEQVDAEGDVGDDVEDRHRQPGEAGVDVVVRPRRARSRG